MSTYIDLVMSAWNLNPKDYLKKYDIKIYSSTNKPSLAALSLAFFESLILAVATAMWKAWGLFGAVFTAVFKGMYLSWFAE